VKRNRSSTALPPTESAGWQELVASVDRLNHIWMEAALGDLGRQVGGDAMFIVTAQLAQLPA
jgi:hypothetical protein